MNDSFGWLKGHTMQFSQATAERLQHYVYMLTDPGTGAIFYVGEGQRQRVFDHIRAALELLSAGDEDALERDETDPEGSEKLRAIARILEGGSLPGMHIVREGFVNQADAQRTEGAVIDVLDYLGNLALLNPLTNQQAGHGVTSFRTVAEVEATHGLSFDLAHLPNLVAGDEILCLNLNNRWPEVVDGRSTLLGITHGHWRISRRRAEGCRYVVAHAFGIVRGVFVPTGWSQSDDGRRIFFDAQSGDDGIADARLRNRNVAGLFADGGRGRGTQNPVRYVTWRPQ